MRAALAIVLGLGLTATACTSGAGPADPVASSRPAAAATTTAAPTTTAPTTTTNAAPTTTAPTTTTSTAATTTSTVVPAEPTDAFFVVAEERERRLAVLGPVAGYLACLEDQADGCRPFDVLATYDLPAQPHNLAAGGGAVFATHPQAGTVSKLDVATGELSTAAVGAEPHDVKHSPALGLLVADEAGHRLLWLDPDSLDVLDNLDLPAPPHDLAIGGDEVWVTMTGSDELARVRGRTVDFHPTGASPHDLIVGPDGRVWFSNWNSHALNVYDPATGETSTADAHVVEPHHFAIGPDGGVWVTDNGGQAVHRVHGAAAAVDVGPVPHHVAFAGPLAGIAVSGSGEAVFVLGDRVVHRVPLSQGLHGIAVVEAASASAGTG